MTTNSRRVLWIGVLCSLLLPILLYASFPTVVTTLLTKELTRQGFKHVRIRLGYPNTRSLRIHELSFEKEIAGTLYKSTTNDIDCDYTLPQLLDGQMTRITIGGGELIISPASPAAPSRIPPIQDKTLTVPEQDSTLTQDPTLTIETLLAPFPKLPWKQLTLGEISIHRSQGDDPLRHFNLHGSLDSSSETLLAQLDIRGPDIPDYRITLSGTSVGDASLAIHSPSSTPPTLAQFSSEAKLDRDNTKLQGSLTAHISNVVSLVKLFYPLDPEISKITGTLSTDWSGTLPHKTRIDSLKIEDIGTIDGTYHIQMGLPRLKPYAEHIAVRANGTFTAKHDKVSWTLSNESKASTIIRIDQVNLPEPIRSIIPKQNHRLSITFPEPLLGTFMLNEPSPSLTADGLIQGIYRIPNLPITLQFSLTHASGRSLENLSAQGKFLFTGTLDKPLSPHIPVKQITWKFSGVHALQKETVTVSLTPRSFLNISPLPIGEVSIPQIDLTFLKRFIGTYDLKGQKWKTEPFLLRMKTPHITWQDKQVVTQDIKLTMNQLNGSSSRWETGGEIIFIGIAPTLQEFALPTTNWKAKFSANPESVIGNVLVQTQDSHLSIYGRFQQHFKNKQGSFEFKLAPLVFSSSGFTIQDVMHPWPYPLDITSGNISTSGKVRWKLPSPSDAQPLTIQNGEATVSVDSLSGLYQEMIFKDLSVTMRVIGRDTWSMPNPGTFTVGTIQSGVEISDIAMNVHLAPIVDSSIPRVELSDFSAHIFGGRFFSEQLIFDATQSENHFSLNIEGLDLGEILKLEQQEGLEGTGLLDGTVPLILTQDGPEVPEAAIAARPPGGTIRYHTSEATAQSLTETNANLSLVLQALSNFQYDVLKIKADYDRNGVLLLKTRLQGNSPNVGRGKPIHFNLNIEENIPALLKSLRIAQGIEEQLEEFLQRSGTSQ